MGDTMKQKGKIRRRQDQIHSALERRPKHVLAIGMISVEIGNLEITLGELLGALLHISRPIGTALYLTPNANMARLQMLENVCELSLVPKSARYKEVSRIISEARAVIGRRHEYMHNLWGLSAANPKVVVRRAVPFRQKHAGPGRIFGRVVRSDQKN